MTKPFNSKYATLDQPKFYKKNRKTSPILSQGTTGLHNSSWEALLMLPKLISGPLDVSLFSSWLYSRFSLGIVQCNSSFKLWKFWELLLKSSSKLMKKSTWPLCHYLKSSPTVGLKFSRSTIPNLNSLIWSIKFWHMILKKDLSHLKSWSIHTSKTWLR